MDITKDNKWYRVFRVGSLITILLIMTTVGFLVLISSLWIHTWFCFFTLVFLVILVNIRWIAHEMMEW